MEALKTYLKEVRDIPLLTYAEELEIAKRIKKGDEQARKIMIRSNLRLVINIAKRYVHLGIPILDLIEEGNIGLMRAVDKFNPKRGFRFSTYAAWWIRQGVTRSILEQGRMIRVPVYMNELIAKWKKKKEQMSQKLKRIPSDEELAKKLHLSKNKMDLISFWLSTQTSSLDEPIGEEEESQVLDLVESHTLASPDSKIEHMLDKERIEGLLDKMTSREKQVLDMRYGLADGKIHTLAEISKKIGVSRERVRQIEEYALGKLRSFVQEQDVKSEGN